MSRKQKLLEKLMRGGSDKNFSLNDLAGLLEAYGFSHARTRGSHTIFKHPETNVLVNLQPLTDGKAKPVQVAQVRKIFRGMPAAMTKLG